jgi:acetyltransferase-like isoleucine patch superfamily enzyme
MSQRIKSKVPAQRGQGVIIGKNVEFGSNVTVWNYVVIGDGAKIGDNTVIGSFCDIGKNVQIGNNCCLQAHVTISNECVLEDKVFIAPNTTLLNDKYPRSGFLTPPTIKKGAIIGGGVTILPNVTIGEEAVVGGGSVVTTNIPAGTVHKGLPSRETMDLQEYLRKREEFKKSRS